MKDKKAKRQVAEEAEEAIDVATGNAAAEAKAQKKAKRRAEAEAAAAEAEADKAEERPAKKKKKGDTATADPPTADATTIDAGADGALRKKAAKRAKDWNCPKCGFMVFESKDKCPKCGTGKNGDAGDAEVVERPAKKKKKGDSATADPVAADSAAVDADADAKLRKKAAKKAKAAENEEAAAEEVPEEDAGGVQKKRKRKMSGEALEKKGLGPDMSVEEKAKVKQKVPDHMHPNKVFINGLPWTILPKTVKTHLKTFGEIEKFDMPKNKEGKSTGTAFVYFASGEGVEKCLQMNGKEFHGRVLKVMRAKRQEAEGKKEYVAPKIDDDLTVFIGGLPFDTDADVLKKDFSACGEITRVRMAKGNDGKFKGIAFVVFATIEGVKKALDYNEEQYGGRTIKVRLPKEGASEKKDKGDGKGAGKGGKDKGKRILKDSRRRVCHAFKEGNCIYGPNCRYVHE